MPLYVEGDKMKLKIGKIFGVGQTKHPVRLRLRGGGSRKNSPQIIFTIGYTYLSISNHYIEYYVYIIYAGAAAGHHVAASYHYITMLLLATFKLCVACIPTLCHPLDMKYNHKWHLRKSQPCYV